MQGLPGRLPDLQGIDRFRDIVDADDGRTALRRAHREVAARELKTRIKTAEREGRIQEAIELTQQLSHIR